MPLETDTAPKVPKVVGWKCKFFLYLTTIEKPSSHYEGVGDIQCKGPHYPLLRLDDVVAMLVNLTKQNFHDGLEVLVSIHKLAAALREVK